MNTENSHTTERAPVIAIMGHIDHGKSTLLSYIRKSTVPLNEAGGITQHVSAYEVEHVGTDGTKHTITFLDTPGHEAFSGIRRRGAKVADIAVLVVSAEDGVKPQTVEALNSIKDSNTPYIVAINKIDKPEANIERTKQSLAENEIYVEGYGGNISVVPISSKTGEGIPELLDMIILTAELESLTGNPTLPGQGIVIESNCDIKKGISATCIVKNGTVRKGMYLATSTSTAPVRIMENYLGKQIETASFSSPIKIIGWDILPSVGDAFMAFGSRDEATAYVEAEKSKKVGKAGAHSPVSQHTVPVIIKADTGGSLEAVLYEIGKLANEKMSAQVTFSSIGAISENDVRQADGQVKAIIIGFNTKVDSSAKNLAERNGVEIHTFNIIYKLSEWLAQELVARTPKVSVDEPTGQAKILKVFSKVKDKQIVGGKVEKGSVTLGSQVKIYRRETEIGVGRVRELQSQKSPTSEVAEGKEFGALIDAKTEIAPGDRIEGFITIEK